jgi:hypothetical protein
MASVRRMQALFDHPDPPASSPFEVLVTEGPVSQGDTRRVFARALVRYARPYRWYSYTLRGDKPEHQFHVRTRHTGWFTETTLDVWLHGHLRKSLLMKMRSDLKINKLWISRDYIHGDSGRACLGVHEAPRPFLGKLWFASLRHGSAEVMQESERTFEYRTTPEGRVQVDLHEGYAYIMNWRVQSDGYRADYRKSWFRGEELIEETIESVFETEEALRAGCLALPSASYCDTDDI